VHDFLRELQGHLKVKTSTSYKSEKPDTPVLVTFHVSNSASPGSGHGSEIVFEDVRLYIRTESEGEIVKELGRLGPQESTAVEHRISYLDLIQLAYRIEGHASPAALFAVRSPEGYLNQQGHVDMPFEGYLTVLQEANLHKWLHGTLKGFQAPGPDTTLGEVRKQAQALRQPLEEISQTKERLQKLLSLFTSSLYSGDNKREAVIHHNRQVTSYLDEVSQAIGQLHRMLESHRTDEMGTISKDLARSLEQSALRLDQATESLKQAYLGGR